MSCFCSESPGEVPGNSEPSHAFWAQNREMAELRDLMRIEWQFAYYPRLWLWWAAGRAGWELQGARVQQNSGQTMYSHPSNTLILFDPFIIVEVDIASFCLSR